MHHLILIVLDLLLAVMQSNRAALCLSRIFRCTAGRHLGCTQSINKPATSDLVPGNINNFIRIFGFKTENTSYRAGNVLYSHRRRLRRAVASFILTPFYIRK